MNMAFSSSSSENNYVGKRLFGGKEDYFSPRASSSKARRTQQQQTQDRESQGQINFDILSWYPKYQSCQQYFVDHAQHDVLVQCFAAFINILLPYQRDPPTYTCRGAKTATERLEEVTLIKQSGAREVGAISVSLIPYIRRLVVTGMDVPQIMHGFFGNEWEQGVGPQRETERRNFLFSAKSGGWANVKRDYDMLPLETVPFLRPLTSVADEEIAAADKTWSEWLAMEDWMLGSRAPELHEDRTA